MIKSLEYVEYFLQLQFKVHNMVLKWITAIFFCEQHLNIYRPISNIVYQFNYYLMQCTINTVISFIFSSHAWEWSSVDNHTNIDQLTLFLPYNGILSELVILHTPFNLQQKLKYPWVVTRWFWDAYHPYWGHFNKFTGSVCSKTRGVIIMIMQSATKEFSKPWHFKWGCAV